MEQPNDRAPVRPPSLVELIARNQTAAVIARLHNAPHELHIRDNNGMTPLMHVARCLRGPACHDVTSAMLKAGADPLATDFIADRTALHWACEFDNRDFVAALEATASHAVRYLQPDFGGKSPYVIARENQFTELLEEIVNKRKAGLKPFDEKNGYSIAVIGMGPAGTAFFIHLIKRLKMSGDRYRAMFKGLRIHLIDDKATLGQGTPYSPEQNAPTSLLNIAAAGMSIDPDQPLDFVLWLKQHELQSTLDEALGAAGKAGVAATGKFNKLGNRDTGKPGNLLCPPSARVDGYYPRQLFGKYTAKRLEETILTATGDLGINVITHAKTFVIDEAADADGPIQLTIHQELRQPEKIEVDSVFYATGHYTEEIPASKAWKKSPLVVTYPAPAIRLDSAAWAWVNAAYGVGTQEHDPAGATALLRMYNYVQEKKEPFRVAILGSSLSAVDAIYNCLLRPDVGRLTWVAGQPTYEWKKTVKVTCFSRRGLFSRVRPSDNRDLDLTYLSRFNVAKLMAESQTGRISLEQVVAQLELELSDALSEQVHLAQSCDPFAQPDAPHRDPFIYLQEDLDQAENGDGRTPGQGYARWYQVVHGLFPVVRMLYRQFTPEDRASFDQRFSSNFLWAFSPMPPRSAAILLAMHKVGALDLYRAEGEPKIKEAGLDAGVEISARGYDNVLKDYANNILIDTTGLSTDFDRDASPFTQSLKEAKLISLYEPGVDHGGKFPIGPQTPKDRSMWTTDDGSFEVLDEKEQHSHRRRAVGFFLHSQFWDAQAVPTVTRYASQAAALYFDELRWRAEMAQEHEANQKPVH